MAVSRHLAVLAMNKLNCLGLPVTSKLTRQQLLLNILLFGGGAVACTALLAVQRSADGSSFATPQSLWLVFGTALLFARLLASVKGKAGATSVSLPPLVRLSLRATAIFFSAAWISIALTVSGAWLLCKAGGNPPMNLGQAAYRLELLFGEDAALSFVHMLSASAYRHGCTADADHYLADAANLLWKDSEVTPVNTVRHSSLSYALLTDAINVGNFTLAEVFYFSQGRQSQKCGQVALYAGIKDRQGHREAATDYYIQSEEIAKSNWGGKTGIGNGAKVFNEERIRRMIANVPPESRATYLRVAGKSSKTLEAALQQIAAAPESKWPELSRRFSIIDMRPWIYDYRRGNTSGQLLFDTMVRLEIFQAFSTPSHANIS